MSRVPSCLKGLESILTKFRFLLGSGQEFQAGLLLDWVHCHNTFSFLVLVVCPNEDMISFKPCILVRMLLLYVVQYIFKGFWASLQSKLERYKLQHLFICFLKIRKKVICHKSSGQGTTKVQTTRETNDLKKKSLKSYTSNISLALKELTKFSGRTWVMAQVESPVSFHKWKVCSV